ncbi:MAG: hypothetical protein U5R14_01880 [Gemmatimonadota bacterium]|nr:hypothetical protein [Gemmatimonadota bacterium]
MERENGRLRVTAWNNGGRTYGLRIGARQRDRYFDQDWEQVQIELDGERQSFSITPGFWNQCPEIRDRGRPVIREWLAKHRNLEWPRGHPPEMELVRLTENRFQLVP